MIHERALIGENAPEHLADAASLCLHFNAIVHPGHCAGFALNCLSGFQIHKQDRKIAALHFIFHFMHLRFTFLPGFSRNLAANFIYVLM
jgi:hypothetical protein